MKANQSPQTINSARIRSLTITAVCIVLVYLFTAVINIRLPIAANGGLVHLGNVPLFIAAVLFGKKTGAIAGGVGMALFDVLTGWALWAPFTLVIVGLMGFTVGLITQKKKTFPLCLAAFVLAAVIKVAGYYLAEALIYGNWIVPVTSIPGNLVQVGVAAVIALVVLPPLRIAAGRMKLGGAAA